jgi:hypothetical protein
MHYGQFPDPVTGQHEGSGFRSHQFLPGGGLDRQSERTRMVEKVG